MWLVRVPDTLRDVIATEIHHLEAQWRETDGAWRAEFIRRQPRVWRFGHRKDFAPMLCGSGWASIAETYEEALEWCYEKYAGKAA